MRHRQLTGHHHCRGISKYDNMISKINLVLDKILFSYF